MNAAAKTLMTAVLAVASAVTTGLLLADQTDPYTVHAVQQEDLFSQAHPTAPGASQVLRKPRG